MTQEEKQLLLIDLCARLPYKVIVSVNYGKESWTLKGMFEGEYTGMMLILEPSFPSKDVSPQTSNWQLSSCKPYLRPMSSMTEEELYEVQEIFGEGAEIRDGFIRIIDSSITAFTYLELQAVFEWFNTYHFDYRGLIEKGLAIEVTEENNPYKD